MATDHLGNTRAVISTTNYSDEHRIEQKNSYYAYGGIMDDVAEGVDVQTHKYNGKEFDTMHIRMHHHNLLLECIELVMFFLFILMM